MTVIRFLSKRRRMRSRYGSFSLLVVCIFAAACHPRAALPAAPTFTRTPAHIIPTPRSQTQPVVQVEATAVPERKPEPAGVEAASPTGTLDGWKTLPVLPRPDTSIRAIYKKGQILGNHPNAFSIFGDCQTRPSEFFGVYETDSLLVEGLPTNLQETILHFHGSFNRESPTAQDGTTPGALLWAQWHQGQFGCSFAETPLECELRLHRPSFAIIQVGTHFESRNTEYLRKIIAQLVDQGVVPILATKADNRELDDRINRDMALLASEFNVPFWNFWAALAELPERGLYGMEGREGQGAIYLNEEARQIHRLTGLQALDIVWRMAAEK